MEQNATRRTARATFARHCTRLAPLLALPLTPDRRVSDAEACIRLGISRTTLWRRRREGAIPRVITSDVLTRLVHDDAHQSVGA